MLCIVGSMCKLNCEMFLIKFVVTVHLLRNNGDHGFMPATMAMVERHKSECVSQTYKSYAERGAKRSDPSDCHEDRVGRGLAALDPR